MLTTQPEEVTVVEEAVELDDKVYVPIPPVLFGPYAIIVEPDVILVPDIIDPILR
jgi:hypothetical protein